MKLLEKINQSHNANALPYIISKMLERTGYYALISILFLYIIETKSFHLERVNVSDFYKIFLKTTFISMLIGGILGDKILGYKKTMLLGNLLMFLGIILLLIPEKVNFYGSLILISLGQGLYGVNVLAQIAQFYLDKEKLLDAVFIGLLLVINAGGFAGPLIGYSLYRDGNFTPSIIFAASMILLSFILIKTAPPPPDYKKEKTNKPGYLSMFFAIGILGMFWYIMQAFYLKTGSIQIVKQSSSSDYISGDLVINMNAYFTIFIAILLFFVFSYFYINRSLKLFLGGILLITGFIMTSKFQQQIPENELTSLYFVLFIIALAELLITPTLYALLIKSAPVKWLATSLALVYVPFNLMNLMLGEPHFLSDNSQGVFTDKGVWIVILTLLVFGILAIINKKSTAKTSE